ncbi:aldehyde reductase [Winogradskya consettensis]|uniref:Dihydroflavonol-4-reductase n=1 Tax=Winogradskya consettensis TaxID=113560 RepID=A0A919T146_9ACTN|nr:aldehyde reductase [Actinoplanes consettensis]GIM83356.1 dihydroflavonol-4-reductase [Actinoplanes consettensis]
MTPQRVLVTGGSGFIAGHCILQLLEQGYLVRTTVRSLDREATVRAVLTDAGMVNGAALSFVAADLMNDAGWADAVAGCDFVLHVASPVHLRNVKNEDDVIAPARNGTLRVLRAARDAGVKRVVLTSAFHAVGYGHPRSGHTFNEDDWTVLRGPGVDAYGRSKTLAERAAWDFAATGSDAPELATILPVAVMGPVMGREISGANHIVQRSLDREMPGYPNLYIPIVDVRDVAAAHLLAMTTPGAAGQRFLVSSGAPIPLRQIGAILRDNLGDAARNVPTRAIPDVVVRAAAIFVREFRAFVPDLGYAKRISNDKARRVLGLRPRTSEEAVLASATSLIAKGLVKRP